MNLWRVLLAVLLMHFWRVPAFAQSAYVHVFPQVADGTTANGSSYLSVLWIGNLVNSNANICTILPYGLSADRFRGASQLIPGLLSLTPAANSWYAIDTFGSAPLATGYLRVSCLMPVHASLQYVLLDRFDRTVGMATVFSAPLVSYASMPMILALRYGVALANDTDSAVTVEFVLNVNGTSRRVSATIPRRGQLVRFADELFFGTPTTGVGILEVIGVSGRFYVTGLVFDGATFSTVVPATNP